MTIPGVPRSALAPEVQLLFFADERRWMAAARGLPPVHPGSLCAGVPPRGHAADVETIKVETLRSVCVCAGVWTCSPDDTCHVQTVEPQVRALFFPTPTPTPAPTPTTFTLFCSTRQMCAVRRN